MIPKRGAIALFLTAAGLALLLSFKTPAAPTTTSAMLVISGGTTPSAGGNAIAAATAQTASQAVAGSTATQAAQAAQAATAASGGSGTYTGTATQTRFGTVQVQITVASGKITDVQLLQYPSDNPHSSQISQYALPTLISETLQAQSAQIGAVSGATYTSQGYMSSLQSALSQAA